MPSARAVTAINRLDTAAMVGSTSNNRLFQIRTGRVSERKPARKIEITSSSKEVRKAKSAAETTPGRAIGSTKAKMKRHDPSCSSRPDRVGPVEALDGFPHRPALAPGVPPGRRHRPQHEGPDQHPQ